MPSSLFDQLIPFLLAAYERYDVAAAVPEEARLSPTVDDWYPAELVGVLLELHDRGAA
jgi:hypothetical protein